MHAQGHLTYSPTYAEAHGSEQLHLWETKSDQYCPTPSDNWRRLCETTIHFASPAALVYFSRALPSFVELGTPSITTGYTYCIFVVLLVCLINKTTWSTDPIELNYTHM
jgi:hypothetical protein